MSKIFFILAVICLIAVLGILFAGVNSMGKGGIEGSRKSNKYMVARVVMQGLIILFLLLAVATS